MSLFSHKQSARQPCAKQDLLLCLLFVLPSFFFPSQSAAPSQNGLFIQRINNPKNAGTPYLGEVGLVSMELVGERNTFTVDAV
jgi:hypothetical protein